MASNFKMTIDKNRDGVRVKLAGDFDATSACELTYAIKKLSDDAVRVAIHTNDMKTIFPFGLDVFHKTISRFNGLSTKIVFIGKNALLLSPLDGGAA
jgi:hypothetical protein